MAPKCVHRSDFFLMLQTLLSNSLLDVFIWMRHNCICFHISNVETHRLSRPYPQKLLLFPHSAEVFPQKTSLFHSTAQTIYHGLLCFLSPNAFKHHSLFIPFPKGSYKPLLSFPKATVLSSREHCHSSWQVVMLLVLPD